MSPRPRTRRLSFPRSSQPAALLGAAHEFAFQNDACSWSPHRPPAAFASECAHRPTPPQQNRDFVGSHCGMKGVVMRARTLCLCLLLVFLFLSLPSYSQVDYSTATLKGTVLDPQEYLVAGAKVTVKNPSTGFTMAVQTGADGTYRAPLLLPGTYSV